jgi:serine/threonine protein kinase
MEMEEEEKLTLESPKIKNRLKPTSFEIMQGLGAGAFGQVWLVKNMNNKEVMAMKVIDKERLIKADIMSYALTEKNIMLQIQHPFIISLKHSFQTPEKYFLLMEYC